jgi:glycosyltransferase involved in cell wall biosynthesis
MLPKISVYLTTYNRLPLLKRAVASLKAQSFKQFEVIIVDDGSQDGSKDFISKLTKEDKRFVSFAKTGNHRGACSSRNQAIKASRSELITGLDDDDWFHPHRLDYLYRNWNPMYSCMSTNWYNAKDAVLRRSSLIARRVNLEDILYGNYLGSQVLTLRSRVLGVGGFDERLEASQDYDLWIRLIEKYGPALRLRKSLYYMDASNARQRISNTISRDNGTKQFIEKYANIMTSCQLASRLRLVSSSGRDPLPKRILDLGALGPRYAVEAIRRRLLLG